MIGIDFLTKLNKEIEDYTFININGIFKGGEKIKKIEMVENNVFLIFQDETNFKINFDIFNKEIFKKIRNLITEYGITFVEKGI